MKIVVASQSPIKLEAVKRALKENAVQADIIGVPAVSDVSQQPTERETLAGARNRITHAKSIIPGADVYIAIENGIFSEGSGFVDRAVVLTATKDNHEHITYSKGTDCPREYVEAARARGFKNTTVGKVMIEAKAADDPGFADVAAHLRTQVLTEALSDSLSHVFKWTKADQSKQSKKRVMDICKLPPG